MLKLAAFFLASKNKTLLAEAGGRGEDKKLSVGLYIIKLRLNGKVTGQPRAFWVKERTGEELHPSPQQQEKPATQREPRAHAQSAVVGRSRAHIYAG